MYILQAFASGYATITDDAQPYLANHLAETEAAAVTLVNQLNAQYLLPALAAYRYQKEIGGVVVGGATVATDRESQGQLNSAMQALSSGFVTSVDWKANGTWIGIDLNAIKPIGAAVAQHVQRCFTAEKTISEQIMAGTMTMDQLKNAFDSALAALTPPVV